MSLPGSLDLATMGVFALGVYWLNVGLVCLAALRDARKLAGRLALARTDVCKCGFVYLGHAFAPCPSCAAVAGWIGCARCGAGVQVGR